MYLTPTAKNIVSRYNAAEPDLHLPFLHRLTQHIFFLHVGQDSMSTRPSEGLAWFVYILRNLSSRTLEIQFCAFAPTCTLQPVEHSIVLGAHLLIETLLSQRLSRKLQSKRTTASLSLAAYRVLGSAIVDDAWTQPPSCPLSD